MTAPYDLARPLVDTVSVHVVSPQWAARVVSPLHDFLSESERRAMLAVSAESVQTRALRRLLDLRAYTPVHEPALFVYRLTERGRDHTGVVASVAVEGFGDGRVLGHERVQAERVAGLVHHYQRVPMRSELVALFHPVDRAIAVAHGRRRPGYWRRRI